MPSGSSSCAGMPPHPGGGRDCACAYAAALPTGARIEECLDGGDVECNAAKQASVPAVRPPHTQYNGGHLPSRGPGTRRCSLPSAAATPLKDPAEHV